MQTIFKLAGMAGLHHMNGHKYLSDNDDLKIKFAKHVQKYNLHFATQEEYNFRFQIYAKKDQQIQDIAAKEKNAKYVLDHNRFSTLTDDEYGKFHGKKPQMRKEERKPVKQGGQPTLDAIDWRTLGAVNPVQNQGACGSCWAFSSAAAMEGAYFVKHGSLHKLSEQQWVDCDDICYGCNGGLEVFAFRYAKLDAAIEKLEDYPYVAKDESCKYEESKGFMNTDTWAELYPGVENELLVALESKPTCVSVNASNLYFQLYTSGILNTESCTGQLDHAVTAVGWGTEDGQKYLIVRNSWGADWGEDGYIRMALDGDGRGVCGVLLDSTTVNVV